MDLSILHLFFILVIIFKIMETIKKNKLLHLAFKRALINSNQSNSKRKRSYDSKK